MVDKLRNQPVSIPTTKLDKAKRSSATERKAQKHSPTTSAASDTANRSMISEVIADIDYSNVNSVEQLKAEFIVKTLTKALGDKASSSSQFKQLFNKIEAEINQDPEMTAEFEALFSEKR